MDRPADSIYKGKEKVLSIGQIEKVIPFRLIDFMRYMRKMKNKMDILVIHAGDAAGYLYVFIARISGVNRIIYHLHNLVKDATWRRAKNALLKLFFQGIPIVSAACSDIAGRSLY